VRIASNIPVAHPARRPASRSPNFLCPLDKGFRLTHSDTSPIFDFVAVRIASNIPVAHPARRPASRSPNFLCPLDKGFRLTHSDTSPIFDFVAVRTVSNIPAARPAQNRVRRLNHFASQCNALPHFPPASTADSHDGRDSV